MYCAQCQYSLPFSMPTAVKASIGTQLADDGRVWAKIADTGIHSKTTGASQPRVDITMNTVLKSVTP